MSAAVEAGIEGIPLGFSLWILIECGFWNNEAFIRKILEVLKTTCRKE
jgi:hypothetical protein